MHAAVLSSGMIMISWPSVVSSSHGRQYSRDLIQDDALRQSFFGSRLKLGVFKRPDAGALSRRYGLKQPHDTLKKVTRTSGTASARCLLEMSKKAGVSENGDFAHKVVIVGGGIAGLSAAVALHRVGVKVLVLEQSSSIRASGTSLSLWGNAWRALQYLGVAEGLRQNHINATGINLFSASGKLLRSLEFTECPGGPHEVRGVERKLLVEALAAQLPAGTIQLDSRVRAIRRDPQDKLTTLELENGSVISTRVLVGCDGVNSIVGKWMGLPLTRYVGQIGIRGVALYPDRHDFGSKIVQYLGKGERCGIFPFSSTKVYWFVVINRASPGPKVSDPNLVKKEALEVIRDGWPEKMKELVNNTPVESMSRAALSDRWNIPGITPPLVKEGVTLAGDALHPMTPSLGQGGGTAIEDGVILARTLAPALRTEGGADAENIQKALEDYATERQKRTFPITIKSFIFGFLLGIEFAPVLLVRDNLALPKLVSPQSFMSHTLYDVGRLPSAPVIAE